MFGAIAVSVIGAGMGGFSQAIESLLASPSTAPLLTRERVSPLYFFSYTFIPLSSIAFPHICIFCLTARRLNHFKKTVILYPMCMLLIWLPSVFLGVAANAAKDVPAIASKLEARSALAAAGPSLPAADRDRLRGAAAGDDVILRLVEGYAPLWLASLLGACVMAAVMASDSQILALSTMFTEDVFAFYGGKARFGEAVQVFTGRVFVVLITVVAYLIALRMPQSIFDVATQYAFAGYSALSPLLVAALFWRRSTKWGALASTVWTAAGDCVRRLDPADDSAAAAGSDGARLVGVRRRHRHALGAGRHGRGHAAGRADDDRLRPADGHRLPVDAGRTAW